MFITVTRFVTYLIKHISNDFVIQSPLPINLLPHNPTLNDPHMKTIFENIVEKENNAGNQHFLLFPQSFLPPINSFQFSTHIYFVVCKCFEFWPV